MDAKLVVHVAEVEITQETGMGRVAWYWRQAIERLGYEFIHIGPSTVGPLRHKALFPQKAWKRFKALNRRAAVFLVHEPASGTFLDRGAPLAVFSHGLERRNWQQRTSNPRLSEGALSFKTRLLFPVWRLRQCDRGIRRGDLLLLLNRQDRDFAQTHYRRHERDIRLFRNGMDPVPLHAGQGPETFTVLFNGSWIHRKGIETLQEAARILAHRSVALKWILAGTQAERSTVLESWPQALRADTVVVPSFSKDQERDLLARASIFVLPSLFEGQPLSLLQAMAAARCCITTDCCGQRDVVQHDINGLLFTAGDAAGFARLIEECLHDPARRQRLGHNAQRSMADRGWNTVADEVADAVVGVSRRESKQAIS